MQHNVYIVNRGAHDYTAAEEYGTLVFCTTGSMDKTDTSQMFRELTDSMEDSQPEDYLLLTSLTSLCSIACAIFAAKHQQLHLLLHTGAGYTARSIYLGHLKDTHNVVKSASER